MRQAVGLRRKWEGEPRPLAWAGMRQTFGLRAEEMEAEAEEDHRAHEH